MLRTRTAGVRKAHPCQRCGCGCSSGFPYHALHALTSGARNGTYNALAHALTSRAGMTRCSMLVSFEAATIGSAVRHAQMKSCPSARPHAVELIANESVAFVPSGQRPHCSRGSSDAMPAARFPADQGLADGRPTSAVADVQAYIAFSCRA